MRKNSLKYICTFALLLTITFSMTGCNLIETILAPEQKEYKSTIYNNTNKKDKSFNEYDGQPTEEPTSSPENNEEPTPTPQESSSSNLLNQEKYVITFEKEKTLTISDNEKDITFNIPDEFIDYTSINIAKPQNSTLNELKSKYNTVEYKYSGNEGQTIRMINYIYSTEDFENYLALVKMQEKTLKKFQTTKATNDIQEGNVLEFNLKDSTPVAYRVYPYSSEFGKNAIVIASAQIEDKYFYTEIWITNIYEQVDFETMLVNVYNSIDIEESSQLIME